MLATRTKPQYGGQAAELAKRSAGVSCPAGPKRVTVTRLPIGEFSPGWDQVQTRRPLGVSLICWPVEENQNNCLRKHREILRIVLSRD